VGNLSSSDDSLSQSYCDFICRESGLGEKSIILYLVCSVKISIWTGVGKKRGKKYIIFVLICCSIKIQYGRNNRYISLWFSHLLPSTAPLVGLLQRGLLISSSNFFLFFFY
jgi:hypothetical protein